MSDMPYGYDGLKDWANNAPVVTVRHPSGTYSFTGRIMEYVPHESKPESHEIVKIEIKDFNMNVTVGETWEITNWVF